MSNLKCNELDDARGGQDDDRNARMHPSSRIQKRPRSHGTHNVSSSGNNSSTAAPALHTSAFVAAARCFILCSHVVQCSPGDATSCPQFHVHVQTQAHVVEPHPVTQQYPQVYILLYSSSSSTRNARGRLIMKMLPFFNSGHPKGEPRTYYEVVD